jgi:hypothetical protein
MTCSHASKIWFGSNLSINFSNTQAGFDEWLCYAITNLKEETLIYIAAITYGIWYARNQQVFEDKDIPDIKVIHKANTTIQDFVRANTNEEINYTSTRQIRSNDNQQRPFRTRANQWRKPDEGTIKINSDASLTKVGKWGLGVTCRDSTGMMAAAATWEVPGNANPLLAEAYALYLAVHFAIDCCFRKVEFESDSVGLIKLLNSNEQNPRNYLGSIVEGIKGSSSLFRFCSFKHINRESNQAAHNLALWAHNEPNGIWIEDNPLLLYPTFLRTYSINNIPISFQKYIYIYFLICVIAFSLVVFLSTFVLD